MPTGNVYARIVDDLVRRYGDMYPRQEVAAVVATARADLEPESRHPEFIPLLAERRAREVLRERAQGAGLRLRAVPEVLFVSVHNECRSQLAAALTEHLGGGHVRARAAGPGGAADLDPDVVDVLGERGIDLTDAYPAGTAHDVLNAADVIVRMDADVEGLPGRRVVDWDVEDPRGGDLTEFRRVRDELEVRVRDLLGELDVPVREKQPAALQVA